MNYRHAFHAGNFADVTKHVLLCRILLHLRIKPAPFRVVDTHAGIGLYDLAGDEAGRTGEWRDGIGRLADPFEPEVEALLRPYRDVLAEVRARHGEDAYPGSPAFARELLRPGDRIVAVEKHPEDAIALRRRFNPVSSVKVLELDGWTALKSLLPPPERRGLVLIDPPYEERGELERAAVALVGAVSRWPTGIFALWYPVKNGADAAQAADRVSEGTRRPCLRLELAVGPARNDGPLAANGLLVVNPPWTLAADASRLLPALADRLARVPGGGRWTCAETPAG